MVGQQPSEDAELRIKLAVADEGDTGACTAADPLTADRAILAAFSSCVRGLPAEAVEWDVSNLLIEGQPVQRHTAVSWLNIAYSKIEGEPFEQQDSKPQRSMTDLSQLLAFADAVGSSKGLLQACLSDLGDLSAWVSVPATGVQVGVHVGSRYFWQSGRTILMQVGKPDAVLDVSAAEAACIPQQVATQTEQLLYLAHKLQLPALQQKLHVFLSINTHLVYSLLYGYMGHVLTERVLDAAMGKQLCRGLVINSIITQQGGFSQHKHAPQLLEPLDLTPAQQAPLKFKAKLTSDAFGYAKGETVSVELQLLGHAPSFKINGMEYVAQVLVGTHVWDDQSLQAVMGPGPAAAEGGP